VPIPDRDVEVQLKSRSTNRVRKVANPSPQKRVLATKLTNPLGWYLPISEDEIERNRALVQNPYYDF